MGQFPELFAFVVVNQNAYILTKTKLEYTHKPVGLLCVSLSEDGANFCKKYILCIQVYPFVLWVADLFDVLDIGRGVGVLGSLRD